MDAIKENWENIKEIIKKEHELTPIAYDTWVKPLEFHNVKNDIVSIIVPADKAHLIDYISKKYEIFFQFAISDMFDHNYEVNFISEKDAKEEVSKKESSREKNIYNINYESANLNAKYNFDTFVVGKNNNLAYSAAVAVAESPGDVYNPLYIYGKPGLGKTHLMHSIGHYTLDQNPEKKVLYVTSEEFTNEVIESIRSGNHASMANLREKYRTVDVLMIDDIQFIIGKESTQEEFFHTFNALHLAGKQIILSSDKNPKELTILDERFRSRFECGLTVDIQPPDYDTRVAILRNNAKSYEQTYEHKIDAEIIDYIASNIESNIRELEGALNKVIAFAKLNKEELTKSLAEEALKDVINPNRVKEITPTLILNVVAEHFGVMPEDITSKRRSSEFVQPRHVFMYLCRTMTETPLSGVAKFLGLKDHTSVMNGVKRITTEQERNEELRNKIDIIKKKISPSYKPS